MRKDAKIYVAGHRGLVGSAIQRCLEAKGYSRLVTRTHDQLDLLDQTATAQFFASEKPEYVLLAAAKVGGIHANNSYPAEFIYQNLTIQNHVLHHSYRHGVRRLIFLGSACIYPKITPQPICEEQLLSGPLEPTNAAYALAKIAGIEMCWSYNRQYGTQYLPLMPANLYGPGDNFDLEHSHVLPAMIRKFNLARLAADQDWEAVAKDEAVFGPIPDDIKYALGLDPRTNRPCPGKKPAVVLWGSGKPRREFMLADDLADACLHFLEKPWRDFESVWEGNPNLLFNVGIGADMTIQELAAAIAGVVGYHGQVKWDRRMPDGTPCKLLDSSRLKNSGWRHRRSMSEGIERTYQWYLDQVSTDT